MYQAKIINPRDNNLRKNLIKKLMQLWSKYNLIKIRHIIIIIFLLTFRKGSSQLTLLSYLTVQSYASQLNKLTNRTTALRLCSVSILIGPLRIGRLKI